MCPRSSDPFYILSYYIKWVTTSWTHSTLSISYSGNDARFIRAADPDPIFLLKSFRILSPDAYIVNESVIICFLGMAYL